MKFLWHMVSVLLLATALGASAQQEPKLMDPMAHPKFDVATIKPAPPDSRGSGFTTRGETIFVRNMRMSNILAAAFNVHKQQLQNVPDWCETQQFDIQGNADVPGAPSWPQYQEMLRSLLQERLGLRFHHETREMQRFTMQVARGGIKFSQTKYTGIDIPDQSGNGEGGKWEWRMTNNTMDDFAGLLRGFLDHPVVNETGLKGKYDFTVRWAREDAPAGADAGGLPGLLTALQEQLGLRVEASKGPTDVIVIDHVEKPSDN